MIYLSAYYNSSVVLLICIQIIIIDYYISIMLLFHNEIFGKIRNTQCNIRKQTK